MTRSQLGAKYDTFGQCHKRGIEFLRYFALVGTSYRALEIRTPVKERERNYKGASVVVAGHQGTKEEVTTTVENRKW